MGGEREGPRADLEGAPAPPAPGGERAGPRYVQLSPAYDADAAEAARRGWPVTGDGTGNHLDVAVAPERIADLLG